MVEPYREHLHAQRISPRSKSAQQGKRLSHPLSRVNLSLARDATLKTMPVPRLVERNWGDITGVDSQVTSARILAAQTIGTPLIAVFNTRLSILTTRDLRIQNAVTLA